MRPTFVAFLALASMLVTTGLPANAGHGAPYTLTGTATETHAGAAFDAELRWSGPVVFASGNFLLTLSEPSTGQRLPPIRFAGHEQLPPIFSEATDWCPVTEIVDPYGAVDDATGGQLFSIEGFQEICFAGPLAGERLVRVSGHFATFDLVLGTDPA